MESERQGALRAGQLCGRRTDHEAGQGAADSQTAPGGRGGLAMRRASRRPCGSDPQRPRQVGHSGHSSVNVVSRQGPELGPPPHAAEQACVRAFVSSRFVFDCSRGVGGGRVQVHDVTAQRRQRCGTLHPRRPLAVPRPIRHPALASATRREGRAVRAGRPSTAQRTTTPGCEGRGARRRIGVACVAISISSSGAVDG